MAINTNGINFEQLQFNNFQLPAVNGNNLNQIQTNIKNAFNNLLESIMPIGKIEIFLDAGDYSNYMGFKWKQVAQGRNLVGVGEGTDKNSNTKEFLEGNNDGEYSHNLLREELPKVNIKFLYTQLQSHMVEYNQQQIHIKEILLFQKVENKMESFKQNILEVDLLLILQIQVMAFIYGKDTSRR